MSQEFPIVGPSAEDRSRELVPEAVTLAGGVPLYHALLDDPNALVVSASEAQEAKEKLAGLIDADPASVLSCQGVTLEEARAILTMVPEEEEEEYRAAA